MSEILRAQLDRVPPRKLFWRRHPNGGRVAIVAVPKPDAVRLLDRGWLKINGHRATVQGIDQEEPHNTALCIRFDVPYPEPHP